MGPAMNSFYTTHDISNEITPSSPRSATDSAPSLAYHSPMAATSIPSDILNHRSSAAGGNYTSSTLLPSTLAPSYPLYSYPQAQTNHSSSLLSYATPQQSSNQSHGGGGHPHHHQHHHHHQTSWDSAISLQPSTSAVYGHGMYNYGASSHNGADQYQITPSNSGA